MIYDTLNNLPNYLGVSDNLDTVIEYIMARDITTLPAGRTRIDGEKAVVTVSTVTPQSSDKALFQRHDAHIVLETDLEGSELFEVSLAELTPTKPTDEAADTTVGTAGTSIAGMLCEGRFALYLAGEPYKSGLKAQGCGKLKKAVFTIELDPDEEEPEEYPTQTTPPLPGAFFGRGGAFFMPYFLSGGSSSPSNITMPKFARLAPSAKPTVPSDTLNKAPMATPNRMPAI